jgi:cephalosporin-C deacetylase
MLRPLSQTPRRGLILGHGYAGIQQPDFELPQSDTIYCMPCFRTLGRRMRAAVSTEPQWHVLHDENEKL